MSAASVRGGSAVGLRLWFVFGVVLVLFILLESRVTPSTPSPVEQHLTTQAQRLSRKLGIEDEAIAKKKTPDTSDEDAVEKVGVVARATAPSADSSPTTSRRNPSATACEPICLPLLERYGNLYAQIAFNGTTEPEIFKIGPITRSLDKEAGAVEGRPYFSFPPHIRHVAIDIGTNVDPDTHTDYWGKNKTFGFLWFEPQRTLLTHPLHLPEVRAVQGIATQRVFGFPAAVSPTQGMMKLFISATHGCTSMLPMNDAALRNPDSMRGSFKGGSMSFPNWKTAQVGFENCIKSSHDRKFDIVPTIKGASIVAMIPPRVNLHLIMVDAQGFDLFVTASFGFAARRADVMVVECQDLPEGHPMFLTQGAFSCSDIRECIEAKLPHVMVDSETGLPGDACNINNPSHERNCLFRRMDRPFFPKAQVPFLMKREAYRIKYAPREKLQCPKFAEEIYEDTPTLQHEEKGEEGGKPKITAHSIGKQVRPLFTAAPEKGFAPSTVGGGKGETPSPEEAPETAMPVWMRKFAFAAPKKRVVAQPQKTLDQQQRESAQEANEASSRRGRTPVERVGGRLRRVHNPQLDD